MRFLGLISGGKDSIFNMQMAIKKGHLPVCLLNMKMTEEKDSFMFQYAGCNIVPGIAECLELPLHQISTSGVSKKRSIDYEKTEEDEIEDLFAGIRSLQDMYFFEGVSVGAISSVYQYNRIKNVCKRLGLEMLGYLWGMDQENLLMRMIKSGMHAVVVKGGGFLATLVGSALDEVYTKYSEHIEKQVAEHKGLAKSDFNLCGEGGEYETLTLDSLIYSKRIEIEESNIVDDGTGVKSLNIFKYKIIQK